MFYNKIITKLDKLHNDRSKLNYVLSVMAVIALLSIKTALALIVTEWYALTILSGFAVTAFFFILMIRNRKVGVTISGKLMLAMEFVVGASFIVNGLMLHVVAYSVIGLVLGVMMPAAQYALATNNSHKVIKILCQGTVITYVIFLITNFLLGPILKNFQYRAIMGNCNLVGYFLVVVIPSLLFFLMQKDLSFKRKAVCWGLLVSALTMMVFTSSRTSVLATFFGMGYFLIIVILKRDKSKKRIITKKQVITVITITVIVPFFLFFMLTTGRRWMIKAIHWVDTTFFSNNSSQVKKDKDDEEEDFNLDYYIKGLDGENADDAFTSGRILIWKSFASNLSIQGHADEHREIKEETRYYEHANAHNVYLQTAYSAGVIAGAAYLVLVVTAGVRVLMWFIRIMRKKENYNIDKLIACYFVIGFAVVSLTSDSYMVFSYFPTTMFWLAAHALIFKQKETVKSEDTTASELTED